MKIYDTHSDVFSNLYERSIKKEKDIFNRYHTKNLEEGQIKGGIWVVYSAHEFDVYEAYKIALKEYSEYANNYDIIYGLEGLRNVKTIDDLKNMYDLGVRHASLTWNEENHLATGVAGDSNRGLQEEGKRFLDFMLNHNMIIDVTHLNIKSFYDVCEYAGKNIIASHSNAFALSDHRRNLNNDQLKVLKEIGGYVGAVSARNFVSKDKSLQNVEGLTNQIIYLAEHIGIDHVMLGLDMMDYLIEYENENDNLDDLASHKDAQNLVKEVMKRNLTESEIEGICYKNFINYKKGIGL